MTTFVTLSPFLFKVDTKTVKKARAPAQARIKKFGVLQPQEVILGLFGEYVGLSEMAWSGGLVQLLGDLGFSGGASRIAFNRVIKRSLLAPVKKARFVFYRITPRLKLVHDEGRAQTFSAIADPEWSGKWTLVWYALPEKHRLERARLGRWLNLRGYGALQDGTWIAAGDNAAKVRELVQRLGIAEHVITFVAKLSDEDNLSALVNQAWHIKDLRLMYDRFVAEFEPYTKSANVTRLDPRKAFIIRTRLIEMFRTTTTEDPRLPDRVLSVKWQRRETIRIFQKLQADLRDRAADYFRKMAVTGPN
jgi:phenylacetic acid degradation operon negative regulatory protein